MKHILLIEDDIWLAALYHDALTLEGFSVQMAHSADQALGLLDAKAPVDLLVLDMFLPGHNGIELLHEIASYTDINTVPIMLLTSVSSQDFAMEAERWKQYGVVEYLYKPETKPYKLIAAIKKQLLLVA